MLIIIEGCDGVGKTTLAYQLAERLPGVRGVHRGPPTSDPLEEYELDLQHYRPGTEQNIICDRWHWGELVYGPLYRGGSRLTTAGFWHVDLFLAARGGIVVHLDEPYFTVHQRLKERGEDFLLTHDISKVLSTYRDVSRMAKTVTLTSGSDVPSLVDTVLAVAQVAEDETIPLADFTTYVGSPRPDVLVLGERRGPKQPQFTSAFAPLAGTSGLYLLESLQRQSIRASVGLANACEENVEDLWNTVGRPRIVTLGVEANKRLLADGVPHGAVPHPQYVRRFHNHSSTAYGELIMRSAATGEDNLKWRP